MLTNKIFRIILLLTAITAGSSTKIMPMGNNNNTVQEITAEDKNQLKLALENGNLEAFEALYKKNPNILQIKGNLDLTLLHFAFINGHLNIIEFLFKSLNSQTFISLMNAKTAYIYITPLHLAFINGHLNIIAFLLKSLNKQTFITLINAKACLGDTALHIAFQNGHEKIIEFLLKSLNPQTLISLMKAKNKSGFTPLHLAFLNGHLNIIEFLLKSLNPQTFISLMNAKENDGFTPLHLAFQNGHEKIIEFLLKSLNPQTLISLMNTKTKNGNTPLHLAFLNGHEKIIEFLLKSLNPQTLISIINANGFTPFHIAFQNGHLNIIEFILKSLNPETFIYIMNTKTNSGHTPLHLAFQYGHEKIIEFLLKSLNPENFMTLMNAKKNDGFTPLHLAFINGHLDIIKFIYNLDENHELFISLIDTEDNNGSTPLHYAFEQVQDKVIKFIYDKFATEKINNISNKIEFSKKLLSNNKLLEFILNKIKEENNGELKLDYFIDKNGDTLVSALSKNPECLSKIILDNFNPYIDPDKDEIDKLLNMEFNLNDTEKNNPVGILIYKTLKYCKCNIDKTKNFFSNIMYKIQELFMSEEAIDKEKIKNKNNKNFINNLVNNAMVLKLLKKWIPQQTFTNNYANTEHSEKIPCCTPLSNDVLQEHIMGFAGYTCFDNPKNKKVIEILRSKDFNDSLINKFANNDTSLTFFPENKIN